MKKAKRKYLLSFECIQAIEGEFLFFLIEQPFQPAIR